MRTLICFLTVCLLAVTQGFSQVKIGDNPQNIDASSVLELESASRVLVITRLSASEMNSITPLRGALVYNTDEQCVFYYNGSQWVNVCTEENTTNVSFELVGEELVLTDSDGNSVSVPLEGVGEQSFTAEPIVNFRETIIITQTGNTFNFEVDQITGENIADSTIQGVDFAPESITQDKIAQDAIGTSELQDNAVTDMDIDFFGPDAVTLSDFDNDAGFLTISAEPDNAIVNNFGAFYDDSSLQTHIADDGDLSDQNEIQNASEVEVTPNGNLGSNNVQTALEELQVDIDDLNAGAGNTDEQELSTNGNPGNISIDNGNTIVLNVEDGDADDTNEIQDGDEVNIDPITGITGGNVQLALEELQVGIDNLNAGGGNTDEQDLTNVLTQGNNAEGLQIENLQDPDDDQDAATKRYVDNEIAALPAGSDNQNLANVLGQGNNANSITITNLPAPIANSDAATKQYVDDEITALPAGSDNQNLANVLGQGNNAGGLQIENLLDPDEDQDAATKKYVDDEITALPVGSDNQDLANVLSRGNNANLFTITNLPAPVANSDAATKQYVDDEITALPAGSDNQNLANVLGQGNNAGGSQIENLLDPDDDQDAATKKYVDDNIVAAGGGVPTDELITNFALGATTLTITEDGINWPIDLDPTFVTEAELALYTTDWANLTGVPADFADDVD
ncbi:hypothetical protein, partial [Croceitalea rosinachiae]